MAKKDTTKNFSKVTGSLAAAKQLIRSLLEEGELLHSTEGRYSGRGNQIAYARGNQLKFNWSYDPDGKRLYVTYTDGRSMPEEKEKPEYYVIWIEGLEPKTGEKIKTLLPDHTYTTSMTQAMRVRPKDRELVKNILRSRGIANWVLENCMIRTNYAPKGTIFNP